MNDAMMDLNLMNGLEKAESYYLMHYCWILTEDCAMATVKKCENNENCKTEVDGMDEHLIEVIHVLSS